MEKEFKKITHTFLQGRISSCLIIPIEIARKHGLNYPSNVVVQDTEKGILIRKIDICMKFRIRKI